ncbi:MAG: PqqD family protein [Synergistaceae bacterium]|nr:PqqD family protein [Synergistaceae bacterium]
MKLRGDFLTHQTDSETLLVPAGNADFSGIIKGNATFGEILSLLKDDITESQIITEMCAKYDAPEDVISQDVRRILDSLRQVRALEE